MRNRDDALRLADAARPAVANVVVHQRIDSTHAWALRLIEQAESEEMILPTTLVIAGEQEHGQGRAGRRWVSPPGGLYLSWISAGLEAPTIALLPMIAAAAAHTAIVALGIEGVEIKWPNDILVAGRKLAGLLVHSRHGVTNWVTVGVGINIDRAPKILDGSSTRAVAVTDLIAGGDFVSISETVVRIISEELQAGVASPEEHIERWRENLHHLPGDEMTVRAADGSRIRGRFAGLTDDGHLRLTIDGVERIISAGDVIE